MFSGEGIPGEPTLAEVAALDSTALGAVIQTFQEAFTWWRRPDLVTVAAVQGHAVGAGFQLALACDVRIVSDDVQFSMREPSLGLVPDLGGTAPLVHAVGYSRALEICLTGRWVDATEAISLGLALRSTSGERLRAEARAVLDALVVGPAPAAAETKALLQGALNRDYDEQRAAERAAQTRILHAARGLLGAPEVAPVGPTGDA
jgi:enoyl-CoA hydratase/carnithine racemase